MLGGGAECVKERKEVQVCVSLKVDLKVNHSVVDRYKSGKEERVARWQLGRARPALEAAVAPARAPRQAAARLRHHQLVATLAAADAAAAVQQQVLAVRPLEDAVLAPLRRRRARPRLHRHAAALAFAIRLQTHKRR